MEAKNLRLLAEEANKVRNNTRPQYIFKYMMGKLREQAREGNFSMHYNFFMEDKPFIEKVNSLLKEEGFVVKSTDDNLQILIEW